VTSGVPEILSPDARALYASIGSLIASGVGADRAYGVLADVASLPYIERGFAPAEARQMAVRAGETIPRSQVRQIAGEVRAALGLSAELTRQNVNNPLRESLYAENSALATGKFITRVSMLLVDPVTGFTVQQFANYVSEGPVPPSEALEAFSNGDEDDPRYPAETGDFQAMAIALHSAERGTR
jgi:hypothetical protein